MVILYLTLFHLLAKVWYHDGIETMQQCIHEGYLVDYNEDNLRCKDVKICVGVIYAL